MNFFFNLGKNPNGKGDKLEKLQDLESNKERLMKKGNPYVEITGCLNYAQMCP